MWFAVCLAAPGHSRRPNILVIMADDWSWPHASVLGDPLVRTPTFDRVAREGILLENAFVSAPSCTPSRLALASGQYHWRLAEGKNLGGSLRAGVAVYAEMLQAAGYQIGYCGKGAGPSDYRFTHRDPFGPRFASFEEFLRRRRPGRPFCFWFGAGQPHRPYVWHEGVRAGLDPEKVSVPACLPDTDVTRGDLCDYYHRVEQFDRQAGRVLEQLQEAGELDDTIVVITSDNGMPFPRCKATVYDTGIRVPLAIRWGNRVRGGRRIVDFVSLCDLAPTFLEAAGLEPPLEMTGRSLMPVLLANRSGAVDRTRNYVLAGMERHVFAYPCRAIRTAHYLYIINFDPQKWPSGESDGAAPPMDFSKADWPRDPAAFSFNIDPSPTKQFLLEHRSDPPVKRFFQLACGPRPEEELYDLRKDPDQLHNVAQRPEYRPVRRRLRSLLMSKLLAARDPRVSVPGYQVRSIHGWTVLVSDRLLEEEKEATEKALELMEAQLEHISRAVPAPAVAYLRSVPLWLSPTYPNSRPQAEYHPDVGWLLDHGRRAALAKCVEFTNIRIFQRETERMPVFVLHELAHAYHDQVLDFDNPEIEAAYRRAVEGQTYDKVKRWHGGGRTTVERSYAMTNAKEYFAETTEAFFGRNDFYPFTREELKKHDPRMFALLKKVWLEELAPACADSDRACNHSSLGDSQAR